MNPQKCIETHKPKSRNLLILTLHLMLLAKYTQGHPYTKSTMNCYIVNCILNISLFVSYTNWCMCDICACVMRQSIYRSVFAIAKMYVCDYKRLFDCMHIDDFKGSFYL